MEEGQQLLPTRQKRHSKKLLWTLICVAIIIVAAGATAAIIKLSQPKDFFTVQARNYASFPLYYPTKLPPGYTLDKNSISEKPDVITFVAKNLSNKQIFFSVQPKPANTDVLYQKILKNSTQVLDNDANVTIGQYGNQVAGSFVTPKTLVLVTAPGDISKGALASTMVSLKESH